MANPGNPAWGSNTAHAGGDIGIGGVAGAAISAIFGGALADCSVRTDILGNLPDTLLLCCWSPRPPPFFKDGSQRLGGEDPGGAKKGVG